MAAYARQAVVRTSSGWSVSGLVASNVAAVTFPACASGSATCTYAAVGSASSGAGRLFYFGALSASLAVSAGITPSFAIGALTFTLSAGFATTEGSAALSAIFQAVTWANVTNNASASPLTNLYVSLHTANPGVGGDQTTSEASYS